MGAFVSTLNKIEMHYKMLVYYGPRKKYRSSI